MPVTVKCFHPISIRVKGEHIGDSDHWKQVPCGKCPACLFRYRDSWRVRLEAEFQSFGYNGLFITLTYDDEHLPFKLVSEDTGLLVPMLDKERISKFYKSLKNAYDYKYRDLDKSDRPRWSYFLVGEYGSRFERPHYHMLLFCERDYNQYWDDLVHEHWKDGFVFTLPIITNRIQYVCKYTLKYRLQDCKDLGLTLPFARMSKGIGKSILDDPYFKSQHYEFKPLMYDLNCYPIALPRYYKNYLYDKSTWDSYAMALSAMSLEEEQKLLSSDLTFGVPRDFVLSREMDAVNEQVLQRKIEESLKKNVL